MPGYTITQYRPQLQDQVAALHGSGFGVTPAESRDYIEWKYERNPYIAEPLIFLAQDPSGAVVGMRGYYGSCWEIDGQRMVIPCADDFTISAEYRNSGVATEIMRTAQESLATHGYSHVLNASASPITTLQSLAMGWKSLGAYEPVARVSRRTRITEKVREVLHRSPIVWRLANFEIADSNRCFRRLIRTDWPSLPGNARITVQTQPRPAAMATCAKRTSSARHLSHVHDEAFYRWRLDNPSREYVFAYLERDGALAAYLVIARHRTLIASNLPFSIVDWAAAEDSALSTLLGVILARGKFPAIGTWAKSWSADGQAMLATHGFEPTETHLRARGLPCLLIQELPSSHAAKANLRGVGLDLRPIDSMRG